MELAGTAGTGKVHPFRANIALVPAARREQIFDGTSLAQTGNERSKGGVKGVQGSQPVS